MSKWDTDLLFSDPGEWTFRKHKILSDYVIPSVPKLRKMGFVSLIDGYAGSGEYKRLVGGSTHIMLEALQKFSIDSSSGTVYACEPDLARFNKLTSNFNQQVSAGLLKTVNSRHQDSIQDLLSSIPKGPALVFLDPQAPTEMEYERDLLPWLRRPNTDLLGIFMSTSACRVAAAAANAKADFGQKRAASRVFGKDWPQATTEKGAIDLYQRLLREEKPYVGLYALRKRDSQQNAYAFFGASASGHGLKLLSDAVARDLGLLKEYDLKKAFPAVQESLFEEDVAWESQDRLNFEKLVDIVRPFVVKEPSISGKVLSVTVHSDRVLANQVFGAYVESDYTKARNVVRTSG